MAKAARQKYSLKVSGTTENLEVIRDFIHKLAEKCGFGKEAASEIELAVDEACTNVIKHAYNNNKRHMLELSAFLDAEKMEVIITDKGPGFDLAKVPTPDIREYAQKSKSGGLGIHLMRSLMDEVKFSLNPGKKNQVSLIKYLREPA